MSLEKTTISSVIWSAVDRLGSQGIQFAISIVLARILLPEQFGLIAMLTIFFAIAQSIMDSGFGSALIQKKDASYLDECSIFYFNIILGFTSAFGIYFIAPYIAEFYDQPILEPLTKFLSLNLIINSFSLVQFTLLSKRLDFKSNAKISLITTLISGCIGIFLALTGWGVWALAIQQVVSNICRTALLWLVSSWRPAMIFSLTSLQQMFGFGSKMLLAGLLDTIFTNLYLIVIGKLFAPASLGYYTRAQSLRDMISMNFTQIISRVMFPVFSSIQGDPKRMKRGVRKSIIISTYIIFPAMIGLASISEPLVLILFTEKWLPSVPYLQLLCLAGMLLPLQAFNLSVIKSNGRSDLYLLLEVLKKILIVVNIAITWRWGVIAIIYGQIVLSVLSYILNSYFTRYLINYPIEEQLKDILPALILASIMGSIVYYIPVAILSTNVLLILVLKIIIGAMTYILLSYLFKVPLFFELAHFIKLRFKKNSP